MECSTQKKWFCRMLIILIACACLGGMLLIGRCVKSTDADYPWPYVVFVDRPVQLTDWESVEELEGFLENDDTDSVIRLVAGADGNVNFNGQCEDRAFQLRGSAESICKRLETEILNKTECIKYQQYYKGNPYNLPAGGGHMICKAIIGNDVYFVEPSNDAIWLAYYLD